ncbi:hypothetical protein HYX00_01520 [Candidatus Woesearchaeota archaeon]|nr:hypothetical protein [Candidatus Woesearchaeota archaeon]
MLQWLMYRERFKVIEGHPDDMFWDYELVGWGRCSSDKDTSKHTSVGSCLAVTIYDGEQNRGLLAHLTGVLYDVDFTTETIIDVMVEKLRAGNLSKLEASLAGGVFHKKQKLFDIDGVVGRLQELGIPIIGEDIGDGYNRAVFLKRNGKVEVYRNKSQI